MRLAPALLATALFVAPLSAFAEPIPAAIAADPVPDKAHPAGMASVRITSHGAAMNAVLYTAAGPGPHPVVLLLHGLPGNEQNLDLAQAIRRDGWTVLTMHYRGSWGSGGRFSLANCVEDTHAALAWLRDPATLERYHLQPGKIVVMGHSMGGYMSARAAQDGEALTGVGLLAAWDIGASAPFIEKMDAKARAAEYEDLPGRVVGADPDSIAREVVAHKDWTFAAAVPALTRLPVLIVTAHDGGEAPALKLGEQLKGLGGTPTMADFDTDHPFSDHRIALTAAILRWLENLPGAPAGR
jgi:pimeloyl-ACP methyl ester carboxylesterase